MMLPPIPTLKSCNAVKLPVKYPSVAVKTPKVLTPETVSEVTDAIPPITSNEVKAYPTSLPTATKVLLTFP